MPLIGGQGPLGTLTVYTGETDAFSPDDAAVIEALAGQAAIAMTNARLIEELDRSRAEFSRQADAERALREIAADISALRDTDAILQKTVNEALRLLDSDSARIDMLEGDTLTWAFAAGEDAVRTRETGLDMTFKVGEGVAGRVVVEGEAFTTGDYLADERFNTLPCPTTSSTVTGFRSVLSAPLRGEGRPARRHLGQQPPRRRLRRRPGRAPPGPGRPGGDRDPERPPHRRAEPIAGDGRNAGRARTRAPRHHRPDHVTPRPRRDPGAGRRGVATPAPLGWRPPDPDLRRRDVPRPGLRCGRHGRGYGGVAQADGVPARRRDQRPGRRGGPSRSGRTITAPTPESRTSPTTTLAPSASACGAMAAAPLRAPAGEVIGTLAISYRSPREILADELDLLQGLADQAAIALTNSNLYELLGESEARYRHLVQNSPDLVWSIDAEARFTFVSDTCERLTGWRPEELLGKHFGALVHESSREVAELDWTADLTAEFQELRGRLNLLHRDGHPIPAEFSAFGTLDEEGRFAGANGSVRDMSERDRLERELRESEERYRFLVENSPDIIFAIDAEGQFTYVSETIGGASATTRASSSASPSRRSSSTPRRRPAASAPAAPSPTRPSRSPPAST